jgi:hypothetical protein
MRRLLFLLVCLWGAPSFAQTACPNRLLVSGYFSTVHVYDACTGTYLQNLDSRTVLRGAQAIRLGPDGLIYVVAEQANTIQRYHPGTLAYVDRFTVTPAMGPLGLAFAPDGTVYVAGYDSNDVKKFDANGTLIGSAFPARASGISGPEIGTTFGPDGNLYVPGYNSNSVIRYDPRTNTTAQVIAPGQAGIVQPRGLLNAKDGVHMYLTTEGSGQLFRWNPTTGSLVEMRRDLPAPTMLTYAANGELLVAGAGGVLRLDADTGATLGTLITPGSGGLFGPTFVALVAAPIIEVPLTVNAAGNGRGLVTSTPAGINCGTSCAASIATGSTVVLTAVASAESSFTGWSGACSGRAATCTIRMDAARNVTATFTLTLSCTPAPALAAKLEPAQYEVESQLYEQMMPATVDNIMAYALSAAYKDSLSHPRVPAGAIDLDGNGRQNIILRSTSGTTGAPQMRVGRLVGTQFQFTTQDDPGANFRLAAVADLEGNGKSDLVFLNTTQGEFGDVRIWTDFQRSTERLWRQVKRVWDVQAVGDLDGDGNADLVWRYLAADPRDTGVSYVWFYNGANTPVVRKRGGAPLDWTLLGAADLNADGAADMVYVSPANEIRILMATTNRTCANLSAGTVPSGYRVVRMADFSGTGRSDIFIRNATTGQNALLSLNATGLTLPTFTGNADDPNASCTSTSLALTVTSIGLEQTDPTWKFYAAGDFNADGRSDIAWLKPDNTLTVWLFNSGCLEPSVINNAGSAPAGFTVYQAGGTSQ